MKFVIYQDIDTNTRWVTTEEEEKRMIEEFGEGMNLAQFRRTQIENSCVYIDGAPLAIDQLACKRES